MSKRPAIDLSSLTAEAAEPMQEATQRAPEPKRTEPPRAPKLVKPAKAGDAVLVVGTAMLEGLSFKVSPEFRKRFKRSALDEGMKLNELLFACYAEWEKARKA